MTARAGTAAAVAAGLRAWVLGRHDAHVQAAVGLLLAHEVWPRRVEFRNACVHRAPEGEYWIDWGAARAAVEAGVFGDSAVLDLAIALGQDRYRFRSMGDQNARLIAEAVAHAVGVTR